MFKFVQSWFAPDANPIGVEFGTECLRLAQVQATGADYRLLAAASAQVPAQIQDNPEARCKFFAQSGTDLLRQGNFRGRRAILSLPATAMRIEHLRMPRMDPRHLQKALLVEAARRMAIDSSTTLLRHLVAGEVRGAEGAFQEVIVMTAERAMVDQLLASASKAGLDVIGMNVEPKAIVDCFSHVYRRKTEADTTSCYVDVGCTTSRAIIARGTRVLFSRIVPVGARHFSAAVASAMNTGVEEARLLRIKLNLQTDSADPAVTEQRAAVERACLAPLRRLVAALEDCRRYHEAAFPAHRIDRLILVGGEARQRWLCPRLSEALALPAQLGDPLVRMGRISDVGVESGIDRRAQQPAWTVAIGLSMGPAVAADQQGLAKAS